VKCSESAVSVPTLFIYHNLARKSGSTDVLATLDNLFLSEFENAEWKDIALQADGFVMCAFTP